MKTTIQQEILLMTGTSFSSRQCWQEKEGENKKFLSETEQLQEACWNGLLHEMLPEICKQGIENKKLYLWQIRENKSCIEIELSELPQEFEKNFSIDPYSFMALKSMN